MTIRLGQNAEAICLTRRNRLTSFSAALSFAVPAKIRSSRLVNSLKGGGASGEVCNARSDEFKPLHASNAKHFLPLKITEHT